MKKYTVKDFESRVNKNSGSECWLWKGSFFQGGYGRIGNTGKRAHRLAYELFVGEIPNGMYVCHKCDNPACVNPEHLFIGTALDNNLDREKKGRTARGERSGAYTHPERRPSGHRHGSYLHPEKFRGENNGRAVLTIEKVKEIRNLLSNGISQSDISRKFNMSTSQINNIALNKSWKDV